MSHCRVMWLLLLLTVCTAAGTVAAQDSDCPLDVQLALEQSQEMCISIGYDQVCYGNWRVTAVPQPQVEQFIFEQPGDRETVVKVRSLSLSAMDPVTNVWGIAHMRLLIDTSALRPSDVRLVLFGEVQVENLAGQRDTFDVTVSGRDYINVRQYPSAQAGAVATLAPGDTVTAVGRLADASWLRVDIEEAGVVGWVLTSLVTSNSDLNTLTAETAYSPYYSPMQAFLYASGGNAGCASVPVDGLIIQTPEGQARVTFLINEVSIDFTPGTTGATAFIQAEPAGDMSVTVLEGWTTVSVGNTSYTVIAGSQISIPLNSDLSPAGPPGMPEPFDESLVEGIMALGFDGSIDPPPPASWEMIAQANGLGDSVDEPDGEEEPLPDTGTTGGTPDADEGRPECPGRSCEAHEHAPGQNK